MNIQEINAKRQFVNRSELRQLSGGGQPLQYIPIPSNFPGRTGSIKESNSNRLNELLIARSNSLESKRGTT